MKVGYLVETPINIEKRLFGGQISFLALIREAMERGVEPFVVVSEEWALTEALESLGVSCLITPIWEYFASLDGAYAAVHDESIQNERNEASLRLITDYFQRNGVELVHMNSRFCGLLGAKAARALGIPYIFHVREFLAEDFGLEFRDRATADEIIGGADLLIGVSDSIALHLADLYPAGKIRTVHNGVDVDRYASRAQARFVGPTIRMAILGRVIEHKGQLEAIRATQLLIERGASSLRLDIIGCRPDELNPYEEMLREYVLRNGLSGIVRFVPFTDSVRELLSACDIGLTCSRKEAFGRVTVEYMLGSLLCIGSNSGGTAEVIRDRVNGLLYPEGEYTELAAQVEWAISFPLAANELIQAGHRDALLRYTSSANAEGVLGAYADVLAQRASMTGPREPICVDESTQW